MSDFDQDPDNEGLDLFWTFFAIISAAAIGLVISGCAHGGIYECSRACKTGQVQSYVDEQLACVCKDSSL